MIHELRNRLQIVCARISERRPTDKQQSGIQGFFVGAIYALDQVFMLVEQGCTVIVDERFDYGPVANEIANGKTPNDDWLHGYYLNDAVYRCAALYGRINAYTHEPPLFEDDYAELLHCEQTSLTQTQLAVRPDAHKVLTCLEKLAHHYLTTPKKHD
jgi:hypothetical protein